MLITFPNYGTGSAACTVTWCWVSIIWSAAAITKDGECIASKADPITPTLWMWFSHCATVRMLYQSSNECARPSEQMAGCPGSERVDWLKALCDGSCSVTPTDTPLSISGVRPTPLPRVKKSLEGWNESWSSSLHCLSLCWPWSWVVVPLVHCLLVRSSPRGMEMECWLSALVTGALSSTNHLPSKNRLSVTELKFQPASSQPSAFSRAQTEFFNLESPRGTSLKMWKLTTATGRVADDF